MKATETGRPEAHVPVGGVRLVRGFQWLSNVCCTIGGVRAMLRSLFSTCCCGFLLFLLLCSLTEASFAQAPGWSRGQQNLAITYDECVRRAQMALQAEGYRTDYAAGAFVVGIKNVHTSVIMCNQAPEGKTWVNIVVASNGDGGGNERERLQAQMEQPGSVSSGGGCQGTGYSLTIEPKVARAGESIAVHVTVPDGAPPEGSWVGLFPAGERGHLGQWTYLVALRPTFTRSFTAPGPGQYEIRVLLDNGYDKVAVGCNFTVQ